MKKDLSVLKGVMSHQMDYFRLPHFKGVILSNKSNRDLTGLEILESCKGFSAVVVTNKDGTMTIWSAVRFSGFNITVFQSEQEAREEFRSIEPFFRFTTGCKEIKHLIVDDEFIKLYREWVYESSSRSV